MHKSVLSHYPANLDSVGYWREQHREMTQLPLKKCDIPSVLALEKRKGKVVNGLYLAQYPTRYLMNQTMSRHGLIVPFSYSYD
ncbi:hypothetical protein BS78_05G263100 [Paspalum vaginatum]|nr:hypothetical protein BS78_05G263100 [Paspalum vaginatum]KAJ1277035.1 hypothetical protein BS78_05G263100 [Paspalum vaginatum]